MARKSGFVRRHNRMVRETLWLGAPFIRTTITAASTAVLMSSLNAAALALRPFTVIRTRGIWSIISDQQTANENMEMSIGHAVVSEQASAIGVTAVPTPVSESDSDLFFVYDSVIGSTRILSSVGFNENENKLRDVDSKAMRKVEDGSDIVSVVETGVGSSGLIVTTFFRQLIKLH